MESSTSVVYVEPTSMSPRRKTVIDILRSRPDFVSGQEISEALGVSRNAVHKHVKSLRKRGYRITGVSRRGYLLEEEPSTLSMQTVTRLHEGITVRFGLPLLRRDRIHQRRGEAPGGRPARPKVRSSSARARYSGADAEVGAGSPRPARGSSFSAVLRPQLPMGEAHLLTLLTGVAVAEAVEAQISVPVHLKWPNDLIVDNRKGGGILLEVSGEYDRVDWVVVGIGINVNTEFAELARRPATDGHVTQDRLRRIRRPQLAARPSPAQPGAPLPHRPRRGSRERRSAPSANATTCCIAR